jgi:hypothetical protein
VPDKIRGGGRATALEFFSRFVDPAGALEHGGEVLVRPRLPYAGVAHHRDKLASRLVLCARPRPIDQRELAFAADEPRRVAAFGRVQHRDEPEGFDPLRLSLQPSGSTGAIA